MRLATLLALAVTAFIPGMALAEPPPALAPGHIPPAQKAEMAMEFQGNLSQAMGARVRLISIHSYSEQDGSTTMCMIGSVHRERFRLVNGSGGMAVNPTQAQWRNYGCTRSNYLLIW